MGLSALFVGKHGLSQDLGNGTAVVIFTGKAIDLQWLFL